MPTLEELHNAYMASREIEDNYNFDDEHEAQKINEYYNSGDEVSEIHWQPVARDVEFEKQMTKLRAMKIFNKGR